MTMRMLIDARHREETRVAVVKGNRIEEFDFESAERKQLKGNIYLAKVTRVEPSLQAAFIDYGGNRHGFLAFSEIHPDYYQIPKQDREALLREEAEHAAEEAALRAEQDSDDDEDDLSGGPDADGESIDRFDDDDDHDEDPMHEEDAPLDEGSPDDGDMDGEPRAARPARKAHANDDQVEALRQRRMNLRRRYKIQDVIRRRQVLLVQIVKEERGNKGAALTTYLSLAGRYCVLMPNTSNGGGISRKISNAGDRKRLKSIMADLALPSSMGCIVRTAGLQRTRTEIKRDFDYLARLWDGIREKTLSSQAPALVYGDSDLLKRAIRDIYNKDIDEVIVEGVDGYRQAREFMRLLMPSHARKVKHYSDPVPLFQRAHVEDQLSAMYHPVVQLKSGGYLVINPTEALVSIDINSGRSTREHNIEQTATATNLEATQEIARQLRLRDMAGLVVIDFIDMDNSSNNRKVEKAMKEALKDDRARIQIGRISSFGLMEMSRQRLRTGVLEASTRACPHCEGTGFVRTASSAGLSALRLVEDEAARGRGSLLTLRASVEAAVYVLNRKRADIAEIEDRYGVHVEILPDGEQEGARMTVEVNGPPPAYAPRFEPTIEDEIEDDLPEEIEIDEEEDDAEEEREIAPRPADRGADRESADEAGGEGSRRRRRRRGRRGRARDEGQPSGEADAEGTEADADEAGIDADQIADAGAVPAEDRSEGDGRRRRSRRGRRGGRRDEVPDNVEADAVETDTIEVAPLEESDIVEVILDGPPPAPVDESGAEAAVDEPAPKRSRSRRRPAERIEEPVETPAATPTVAAETADGAVQEDVPPAPKPRRSRRKAGAVADGTSPIVADKMPVAEPASETAEEVPAPKRRAPRRRAAAPVEALAAAVIDEAPIEPEPVEPRAPRPEPVEPEASRPTPEDADGSDESGEPRRGWWQRTFGT